jgi:hypothetical protein
VATGATGTAMAGVPVATVLTVRTGRTMVLRAATAGCPARAGRGFPTASPRTMSRVR